MHDHEHRADRGPLLGDHRAGLDLLLGETPREGGQHVVVVVAPQRRELAELGRDNADPLAGLHHFHPAVADRV